MKALLFLTILIGSLFWFFMLFSITLYDGRLWLKILQASAGFFVFMAWKSYFKIDWERPFG